MTAKINKLLKKNKFIFYFFIFFVSREFNWQPFFPRWLSKECHTYGVKG